MFTVLKQDTGTQSEYILSVETKKLLTDAFVISKDAIEFTINCGKLNVFQDKAPDNWHNYAMSSFFKKIAIEEAVLKLMRNGYVYSEEVSHIDEETGEKVVDKEAVIKSIGAITTLKTQVKKFFPDCEKESFDYNIDAIVKWCDGKGEATWTDFVNAFKVTV